MTLLTIKEKLAVEAYRSQILSLGEIFGVDSDNIFDYLGEIQDMYPETWLEELEKEALTKGNNDNVQNN